MPPRSPPSSPPSLRAGGFAAMARSRRCCRRPACSAPFHDSELHAIVDDLRDPGTAAGNSVHLEDLSAG
eukprot:7903391-Alexandrium_andersonii.AAC.1